MFTKTINLLHITNKIKNIFASVARNSTSYFFLMVIFILYFRMILSSLTNVSDEIYLASSLVVLLFLSVKKINIKKINSLPIILVSLQAVFYIYAICILFYSNDSGKSFQFILRNSLPTIVASSITLLLITNISSRLLYWCFDIAFSFILPISALIFTVNSYLVKFSESIYRADDLTISVFKIPKGLANQRTSGMLINLENSATAISMIFCYFSYRFIFSNLKNKKPVSILSLFVFFVGLVGIVNTTSITTILSTLIILFLMTAEFAISNLNKIKQNWRRFSLLGGVIVIVTVAIGQTTFDLVSRFRTYFFSPHTIISKVYLDTGENWFDLFVNTRALIGKGNGFGINEVHMTLPASSYGIIPSAGWYLIFFSVIYFSFYYKKFNSHEKSTLYMMMAGFATSLHYAGISAWPNNIIYFLCFVLLSRATQKIISQ